MIEEQKDNNKMEKEAYAQSKYLRLSPHKVRRILNQIRGKKYQEALMILEFMPYKPCKIIKKILESAASNAKNNHGYSKNNLIIYEAFADGGPNLKRFQPRAQGRAFKIHKPTCHITLAVKSII
uniref:Large ribosomal subunit protein uL22c n=1 Tax=Corallina chilensis TaxID=2582857 RepID=A0A4P8VX94_9FLOR|nr:50S ribosomal protein L22 [Corallina chilensis]QCS25556.1 50S ribosomal protein L22 [Corallina chilensis]